MDITYLLQNFFKIFWFVVHLMNCGDSLTTFIPSIIYTIGCSLTCYAIHSFYFQYTTIYQEHIRILLLVIFLYGSLIWMGVVFLAKTAALQIIKEHAEDKTEYFELNIERVTVTLSSLVAILPNAVALFLYIRHQQHLRLVEQFNDLIRSIEDHRTEFGCSNQIQEVPILERRPQSYTGTIRLRSCPNLSRKF